MADAVNPRTDNGSKERVAFDLFQIISSAEYEKRDAAPDQREWALKLYAQCLDTVNAPHVRARS